MPSTPVSGKQSKVTKKAGTTHELGGVAGADEADSGAVGTAGTGPRVAAGGLPAMVPAAVPAGVPAGVPTGVPATVPATVPGASAPTAPGGGTALLILEDFSPVCLLSGCIDPVRGTARGAWLL